MDILTPKKEVNDDWIYNPGSVGSGNYVGGLSLPER